MCLYPIEVAHQETGNTGIGIHIALVRVWLLVGAATISYWVRLSFYQCEVGATGVMGFRIIFSMGQWPHWLLENLNVYEQRKNRLPGWQKGRRVGLGGCSIMDPSSMQSSDGEHTKHLSYLFGTYCGQKLCYLIYKLLPDIGGLSWNYCNTVAKT